MTTRFATTIQCDVPRCNSDLISKWDEPFADFRLRAKEMGWNLGQKDICPITHETVPSPDRNDDKPVLEETQQQNGFPKNNLDIHGTSTNPNPLGFPGYEPWMGIYGIDWKFEED